MKTKLFTALLILTTIPFFAQKSLIQQPSKTELLAYLKTVKINLNNILSDLSEEAKIVKEEYGSQLYKETIKICYELYAVIPKEILSTAADCSFDYTCEELEYLKQQNQEKIACDLMYTCLFVGPILCNESELQPNQEQLIKSIFIKYGKDVSKPIGELLNDFFCTEDNWAISAAIDMTRYINYLLPKINAKIVELEMQL